MDIENFVYYQKGGKVMSLGYEIDSPIMQREMPVVDITCLEGLAVPAGLFLLKTHLNSNTKSNLGSKTAFDKAEYIVPDESDNIDGDVLEEEMYDKLLKLMQPKKSREIIKSMPITKTRSKRQRKRTSKKNKTRKTKK